MNKHKNTKLPTKTPKQADSYSTSYIKRHRRAVIIMVLTPLLVIGLVAGVLYRENTKNNTTQAAGNGVIYDGRGFTTANYAMKDAYGATVQTVNPAYSGEGYIHYTVVDGQRNRRDETRTILGGTERWVTQGVMRYGVVRFRHHTEINSNDNFKLFWQAKTLDDDTNTRTPTSEMDLTQLQQQNVPRNLYQINHSSTNNSKVIFMSGQEFLNAKDKWIDWLIIDRWSSGSDGYNKRCWKYATETSWRNCIERNGANVRSTGQGQPLTWTIGYYGGMKDGNFKANEYVDFGYPMIYDNLADAQARAGIGQPNLPPPGGTPSPAPTPAPSPAPTPAPSPTPTQNTFGKTLLGSGWTGMTANAKRGSKYKYNGSDGKQLYKLGGFVRGSKTANGSQQVNVAVYTDANNQPGKMLSYGTTPISVVGGSAQITASFTLKTPVDLTPGASYWLMYHSGTTDKVAEYSHDTAVSALRWGGTDSDTFSDGPSNPAGSLNTDNKDVSIWGIYRDKQSSQPGAPVPPPAIEIPDANPTNPVEIPKDLVVETDGTLIADFNGDGLNDVARDSNNDGKIDPSNELVIDGSINQSLTDTSRSPITIEQLNTLNRIGPTENDNTITIKAGPLPEAKISKPVAYTFLAFQGIAISGLALYLAITKLAIFAGLKGKLGL